jgi:predicted nucleic acid-binding protein
MTALFADSFYFLAIGNPRDASHRDALEVSRGDPDLVTTSWVLLEVADALAGRSTRERFVRLDRHLRDDPRTRLVGPSRVLLARAVRLYASRRDKEWSLTDCTSFLVMRDSGLKEALTGDRHFEQAGFKALLK